MRPFDRMRPRSSVWLAGIMAGTLVAGGAAAVSAADGDIDTIRLAAGGRSMSGAATTKLAAERGILADQSLAFEVVEDAGDQGEALANGLIDMAIIEPGGLVADIIDGNDFVAVAGTCCASSFIIAMQPDIGTVEDLAGKDVIFGGQRGEPQIELRVALLEAATGLDLDDADVQYVGEAGQSDTWTEQFWNNDAAITVFFARHRPKMIDTGSQIPVDIFLEWPSTYNVMRRDFVEANPDVVERLVRSLVSSQSYWLDPANKDEVIATMVELGHDRERDITEFDEQAKNFCSNMYLESELHDRKLLQQGFAQDELLPIEEWAYTDALFTVQEELGLDNERRGLDVTSLEELQP